MTARAYHGTNRPDFTRFDIAASGIFNVGLRWMNADDNPRFAKDPSLYAVFNQKQNVELRRLFQKLGYDGFAYRNEIEVGGVAADSYCVFDVRQVADVGEEMLEAQGSDYCAA